MDGNFVSVIPTNIMKKVFHQKKKKKKRKWIRFYYMLFNFYQCYSI